IAGLSPSEKYDIYAGDYNYTLTRNELRRTSRYAASWEGLCHGWAPASLHFLEPQTTTVTNPDGIVISFGSSDIKALLTLLQGNYNKGKSYMAGTRCESKFRIRFFRRLDDSCLDVNAGSFHVIMANLIGILKQGFIFDRDPGAQVWNQPAQSFVSNIIRSQGPSHNSAPGTVREVVVNTTITYPREIDPNFFPQNKTTRESFRVDKELTYTLELNANGNIIGGKWLSSDYPDFVWTQDKAEFRGLFAPLEELYNISIQ
ncbi:MAG: hypothetical protein HQK53_03600, partial [Oligoflexia bacterium]|nr:hypothetical protein [Oligoflexia bacterium]